MNLKSINECIKQYKTIVMQPHYDGWRLWELVFQFQQNWDADAADFKKMYQNSFGINSPLWHRDGFYPKKAIESYIDLNEDLVRSIFKDLFNEKRDIAGRISRFVYECDELYKVDRAQTQKVSPHYHDDRRMIHIYLAFRYPDRYSMYNFPLFKAFMDKIGSKSTPKEEDIERFVKVSKTLSTLIQKDKELIEYVSTKVRDFTDGELYPMLMVFELYSLEQYYK